MISGHLEANWALGFLNSLSVKYEGHRLLLCQVHMLYKRVSTAFPRVTTFVSRATFCSSIDWTEDLDKTALHVTFSASYEHT